MKSSMVLAPLVGLALAGSAWSQTPADHTAHHPSAVAQATAPAMTSAEVRKVDKEAGKITLKHEPIANLDMPAMTMVFRVSDPKFLDEVKTGDKVRVAVDKVGGQFTVTKLERTP